MFEIGPALREARERRGLAYNQVEDATAIRSRYLRALEEEDFRILPGPTYAKGFLRAYAEFLGLDGQLFIDEFNSRHHDPRRGLEQPIYSKPRSQPQHRRRQRRESNLVMIALAAIVAIASLIFLATTYNPQQAPPVAPLGTTASTGTGAATTQNSTSTHQGTSTGTTTKHKAKHPQFTVVLTVTNPCWVVLHSGSQTGPDTMTTHGTSMGGYTIDPGVTATIVSRKPLYLSQIGAPASLSISIDNHAVTLPAGTTSATVLRITKTGIAQV
jgi:cytoskeleton protein RodZ